jgi:hypothetical protein
MRAPLFTLLAAASAAALLAACSTPGPTCTAYTVPPGTDLTTPTVTFVNDVVPIFNRSCGLSLSCHGDPGQNQGAHLFLGSNKDAGANNPAQVHANIVNVVSVDLPTMNIVTPGDPTNSFMMHKLDADQCKFDSQCTHGTCQLSMPQSNPTLDVATRDTIRRWIAQGAQSN